MKLDLLDSVARHVCRSCNVICLSLRHASSQDPQGGEARENSNGRWNRSENPETGTETLLGSIRKKKNKLHSIMQKRKVDLTVVGDLNCNVFCHRVSF